MKYKCLKIDYCPCEECDHKYTKVPDKKLGKYGLTVIKGGIEYQFKERIKNVPEDLKKEFFKLMSEGKKLGEAKEAVGIGLGTAGQLILNQIQKHSFYSYTDPYTKEQKFDEIK